LIIRVEAEWLEKKATFDLDQTAVTGEIAAGMQLSKTFTRVS